MLSQPLHYWCNMNKINTFKKKSPFYEYMKSIHQDKWIVLSLIWTSKFTFSLLKFYRDAWLNPCTKKDNLKLSKGPKHSPSLGNILSGAFLSITFVLVPEWHGHVYVYLLFPKLSLQILLPIGNRIFIYVHSLWFRCEERFT